MAGQLAGRRALITGAADGIGLAIAKAYAAEGASLLLTDIQGDRLASAAPAGAAIHAGDLREPGVPEAVAALAAEKLGGLDILVNAAGIRGKVGMLEDTTDAEWREVMSINIDAMFFLTRAVTPLLKKSGSGRIINIGSLASITASKNIGAYTVSKHAVLGLTRALAGDLGLHGVTANAILPALIGDTGLTRHLPDERITAQTVQMPMGRPGTTDEVAATAVFLATEGASFVSGVALPVDGATRAVM